MSNLLIVIVIMLNLSNNKCFLSCNNLDECKGIKRLLTDISNKDNLCEAKKPKRSENFNTQAKELIDPATHQWHIIKNSDTVKVTITNDCAVFNDENINFDHQKPIILIPPKYNDLTAEINKLEDKDEQLKALRLLGLFHMIKKSSVHVISLDITHLKTCHFNILQSYLNLQNPQDYINLKTLTLNGEVGEPQFESLTNILWVFNYFNQLNEITLNLNDLDWKELFNLETEKVKQNFLDELCTSKIQRINLPNQDLNDDVSKSLIMNVFWKFKVNYHHLHLFRKTLNLIGNNTSKALKEWYPYNSYNLLEIITDH